MSDQLDFETYLVITPNKFGIYLIDTKNLKYLYNQEQKIYSDGVNPDLSNLNKFLDKHIFIIEKLINQFVKNIFLIIDSSKINNINISLKKKNYDKSLNKKNLENTIKEIKDLFVENYQDQQIMHILIKGILVDGTYHLSYVNDLNADDICIEVQFKSIKNKFISKVNNILEKYQVKIIKCLDKNYIETFLKGDDLNLIQMAFKIKSGHNHNEVTLVPKTSKNKGFFEKFFQLFS